MSNVRRLNASTMHKFYSEFKKDIPLPPEYTFAQAFNYLNSDTNSFYILERNAEEYIQCGGNKATCTVEVRLAIEGGSYARFTIGHPVGQEDLVHIPMSDGGTSVLRREVLTHWEAIKLFDAFFASEPFPPEYSLRAREA